MKKLMAVLSLLIPIFLIGCSLNTGIETLLSPPKLSEQQELIYNALQNYTGSNISLKYPKSGKNLSAFIVDDLDGDSEDEAIVFYQKNAAKPEDISLRINILDRINSQWRSVYDHTADGNELEQVEIARLDDSGKSSIIVGYSLINRNEKTLSIYDYSDEKLVTSLENESYSAFDTADFNGDGINELFIAMAKTASKDASAALYHIDENGDYVSSYVELDESYINYRNVEYSVNRNGHTSIFMDAEVGNGNVVTEVLQTDDKNNLKNVFCPDIEKGETMRPLSYMSMDIDGDGEIEIPIPYFCDGYDEASETPIYFTSWYKINNGTLKHAYESWFSITNGYVFIIPEKWYGKITAKEDTSNNEVILYSGSLSDTTEEIFRLKIVSENKDTKILEDNGYFLLRSRGDKQFYIKINENSLYVNSAAEIIMRFKFNE